MSENATGSVSAVGVDPKQSLNRFATPPGHELLEELGSGGMGVVYRARDIAFDRDVAMKLLAMRYSPDSLHAQRFLREARITGNLQHPGIPAVHRVGVLEDGRPFLTMKLIKGSTLDAILKQRTSPSDDRGHLLAVFEAICQAVAYAHAHHVIHRDLKPANVMVGSFGEVQVMDWGLAKILGEAASDAAETLATDGTQPWREIQTASDIAMQTQAGTLVGTPAFMPPEQAVGQIDLVNERSDVFGLGALLAVILTGSPPYLGDSSEAVRVRAVRGELADCFARLDACGAEPEIASLCKKCLAFESTHRPANAGEVAAAIAGLRAAADERARRAELERVRIEGEQAAAAARAAERRKRRRLALGAALALAAATVGGLMAVLQVQRHANAELTSKNFELDGERANVEYERAAAVKEAKAATAARRDLGLTLADSYTTLGLTAGERGDPGAAVLWFARAVRQSRGDAEREFCSRIRYRNWATNTFTPVAAFQGPAAIIELVLHPGGRHLATWTFKHHTVWDLDRETSWVAPKGFEAPTAMSWNADGSRIALAAAGKDGAFRVGVFDFPSGKVVRERKWAGSVSVVRFSPDGRTLAVGGFAVRVWRPDDDEFTTPVLPQRSRVFGIEFAPDGKRLVAFSLVSNISDSILSGEARLFELTGESVATPILEAPHVFDNYKHGQPRTPLFADGGRVLITYPSISQMRGIEVGTGKPRFECPLSNFSGAFAVSPDGQTVWVGQGENGRGVNAINVADGSLRPFTLPHTNSVTSIVCASDGLTVLTSSRDRSMCLWDAATGRRRFPPLTLSQSVFFAASTADGRTIASMQEDGLIRAWRVPVGAPARTIEPGGEYTIARFVAGGRYVLPTCGTGDFPKATLTRLQLYDPTTGAPAAPPVTPGGLAFDADISPDGRLMVTASGQRTKGGEKPDEPRPQQTIRVWDVASGNPVGMPIIAPSEPRSVRFSPNGAEAAVLCAGGQILILDPREPRVTRTISQPDMLFSANQYVVNGHLRHASKDGRILVFGSSIAASFWVCDPKAGTLSPIRGKRVVEGYDLTSSPDGAVWARSSQLKVTEFFAVDGGPEPVPPLEHPDWTFSARFNRAGDRLLTSSRDGVARLWDWRAGKMFVVYRHADEIPLAEFLPDERFVITVSYDGTLRVWGAATGEPVTPPVPLGGKALTLDMTPDGRLAVASGFSKHVTLVELAGVTRPSHGDADELDLRAELASNQRITPSGGLAYLTTEEWLSRWHERTRQKQRADRK